MNDEKTIAALVERGRQRAAELLASKFLGDDAGVQFTALQFARRVVGARLDPETALKVSESIAGISITGEPAASDVPAPNEDMVPLPATRIAAQAEAFLTVQPQCAFIWRSLFLDAPDCEVLDVRNANRSLFFSCGELPALAFRGPRGRAIPKQFVPLGQVASILVRNTTDRTVTVRGALFGEAFGGIW